jgi:hypothetical protein
MMTHDLTRYDPVWRAADPYLRARKNDIHLPITFHWCQRLLDAHPEADRDVCLLAAMLHDIGWWAIDMETILQDGFRSANPLQADVRYRHEAEGVRLAAPLLRDCGWPDPVIAQVCEIIDGHDTRAEPRHLNDRVVRDADKLWRFSVIGVSLSCDWFGETIAANIARVTPTLPRLETAKGRELAAQELALTRTLLMLDVIG